MPIRKRGFKNEENSQKKNANKTLAFYDVVDNFYSEQRLLFSTNNSLAINQTEPLVYPNKGYKRYEQKSHSFIKWADEYNLFICIGLDLI